MNQYRSKTIRVGLWVASWFELAPSFRERRKRLAGVSITRAPDRPRFLATGRPAGRRITSNVAAFALLLSALLWITEQPARGVTIPPLWRWANPAPHGANIVDQAANTALTVQVGERGQIFLSDDWETWTPRDSGTTAALRGATFFGGRLVISGENGTIMFADDPWNFYGLTLGTPDWLESVAASASIVVAVGDNAAIYTSTNAVNWQRENVTFTNWLRSVACNGSNFVVVGESGLIASSQSGRTWQVRNSGTTINLNRVAWLGDHFLALGDAGKAFTSSTGNQWSPVTIGATNYLFAAGGTTNVHFAGGNLEARLSENNGVWTDQLSSSLASPAPPWTYYSSLWNSGYYLLAGQTGMCVEGVKTNAAEPTKWQPLANSVRSWLWATARTPSHFVAVGDYGTILSSPNGMDWDYELVPTAVTNAVLLGVGGSSNLLLAVGSQGTVLWGTNVFLWNSLTPKPTTNDLQGVCWDNGQFVLSGGNGTVLTSPDGTNWTPRPTPTSAFLMSITAFPGGLVSVGEYGTILTSTNGGTNWSAQVSGTTNWLSQVRWLHDRLVAVGQNGCLLTSTNATHWSTNVTGTTAWLNAADFLEDTWFVVGNQGTVLGSPNGTNWYNFGAITKKSLYGLTIYNGQLITVGSEGVILRSRLIPDPTPINIASVARSSGMNVFLFTGAPDQQFRLQSSADLVTWQDGALLEFLDSTGTLLYVEDTGTNAPPTLFYRACRVW
jgi:hypothetical protein